MLSTLNLLLSLSILISQGAVPSGKRSLQLDTKASMVTWIGSKVAGSHTGQVRITSGTFTLQDDLLVLADIVMDMTSITCTDLSDAGRNAKLVGHLKGGDFFAVDEHPRASFRTRAVERTSGSGNAGTYKISGDLTIKGVTQPNTFDAVVTTGPVGAEATGTIRFDRTKYGIRYGSGSFFDGLGDRMISDEIVLNFNVIAR
jgi:polyisoprenoid-binding protein YceI